MYNLWIWYRIFINKFIFLPMNLEKGRDVLWHNPGLSTFSRYWWQVLKFNISNMLLNTKWVGNVYSIFRWNWYIATKVINNKYEKLEFLSVFLNFEIKFCYSIHSLLLIFFFPFLFVLFLFTLYLMPFIFFFDSPLTILKFVYRTLYTPQSRFFIIKKQIDMNF